MQPDFVPQPGDVVAKEHFGAGGFANTDLDLLLTQHRIVDVVVVGVLANTCIEGTSRFATELGYRVTLVRDATAAFSADRMHAAHELNAPAFVHAIVTTSELVGSLQEIAIVATLGRDTPTNRGRLHRARVQPPTGARAITNASLASVADNTALSVDYHVGVAGATKWTGSTPTMARLWRTLSTSM
jgi:hypothetical protein